ncbi:MAG: hypothetical protein A2X36_13330 [Elusimicrobia bacterium GWA2_69_24]|nr:MAG: hypothetical protein A2X36_13330 [Elusimicrobia bacterium GWA2_69_24]HBL15756.1 hypothetical protein [Elusimicrobiota bacterium]
MTPTRRLCIAMLALVWLAGSAAPVLAINSRAGTSGAQFLKLGAGSRAGAMGEAYTAVTDDVYAVYYNPAALTELTGPQLGAAHTSYFQDLSYEFAAFAYPIGPVRAMTETVVSTMTSAGPSTMTVRVPAAVAEFSRHAVGVAIYNLSIDDIERRNSDTPSNIGTFSAGDNAYALSYAYRFDRTLGAGVTGKYIHQKIDTYNADAFAMDAAVLYRPYPNARRPFSFAGVIKNLGTRPSFAGVSDPLPLGITLGAGFQPIAKRVKVDLDLNKYRDTDPFVTLGGEYTHPFAPGVSGALRAGFSSHRIENEGFNEISVGAGINFHRAAFDFAWVPFGALGNTFRYALLLKF